MSNFKKPKGLFFSPRNLAPKIPDDIDEEFVSSEVRRLRESNTIVYPYNAFLKRLKQNVLDLYPNISWRNDELFIEDLYVDIVTKAGDYIEAKKRIFDQAKEIVEDLEASGATATEINDAVETLQTKEFIKSDVPQIKLDNLHKDDQARIHYLTQKFDEYQDALKQFGTGKLKQAESRQRNAINTNFKKVFKELDQYSKASQIKQSNPIVSKNQKVKSKKLDEAAHESDIKLQAEQQKRERQEREREEREREEREQYEREREEQEHYERELDEIKQSIISSSPNKSVSQQKKLRSKLAKAEKDYLEQNPRMKKTANDESHENDDNVVEPPLIVDYNEKRRKKKQQPKEEVYEFDDNEMPHLINDLEQPNFGYGRHIKRKIKGKHAKKSVKFFF